MTVWVMVIHLFVLPSTHVVSEGDTFNSLRACSAEAYKVSQVDRKWGRLRGGRIAICEKREG